jgi:hypothetical protein
LNAEDDGPASREILVISSCTARKVRPACDLERVAAGELYAGDQHRRLMEGILAYRQGGERAGRLRLRIVSAGHGLLGEDECIRPYDESFAGLPKREIDQRSSTLGIPAAFAEELQRPRRLTILALGAAYLRACRVDNISEVGGPVLALTGETAQRCLPRAFTGLTLSVRDAQRLGAGFVGLKGAMVARLLRALALEPMLIQDVATLARRVQEDAP